MFGVEHGAIVGPEGDQAVDDSDDRNAASRRESVVGDRPEWSPCEPQIDRLKCDVLKSV